MNGILSVSLSSFQRFPSRFEISALCMSGDCSMILRRSICDHTMNAFMGRLMCPLGVLHQPGSTSFSAEAAADSSASVISPGSGLSAPLDFCTIP
ncbi:Uncharacterized protein DAT39_004306, partial [Clarias magur]